MSRKSPIQQTAWNPFKKKLVLPWPCLLQLWILCSEYGEGVTDRESTIVGTYHDRWQKSQNKQSCSGRTHLFLLRLCWKQQISIPTSNKLLLSVKTAGVVQHWRKKKKPVCVPLLSVNLMIVTVARPMTEEIQVFCSGRKSLHNFLFAPGERVVLPLPQHSAALSDHRKKTHKVQK